MTIKLSEGQKVLDIGLEIKDEDSNWVLIANGYLELNTLNTSNIAIELNDAQESICELNLYAQRINR